MEVRVYKHDGRLHRTWPAELLSEEGSLIVLDARFPDEVEHDLLGTIASGTTASNTIGWIAGSTSSASLSRMDD